MTTPPGVGPLAGEHDGPPRGRFALGKAVAILCLAAAVGAYIVQLGGPKVPSGAAAHPPSGASGSPAPGRATHPTTPTTAPVSPPTTTPGHPKSSGETPSRSISVLVANGSQTNGVAGKFTSTLAKDGWGTLTAVTAGASEQTSSVWYAPGEEKAAAAVAASLGIPPSAVAPVSLQTPVAGATHADVVVVIGDDLAASAP